MSVSLADEVQARRALSDLSELVLLDALWTEHLDAGRAEGDLEPLEKIVDDMDRLLSTLPGLGVWLADVLDAEPEGLTEPLSRAAGRLTSDDAEHPTAAWLEDHQRALAFIRRSAQQMDRTATAERADLQDKITTIRADDPTPGDISQAGLCAIYGGLVGAAMVATVLQPELAVTDGVLLVAAGEAIAAQCF